MTLCLYECLKAVGLKRYYARFTSVGVRCLAHLAGLTMEDYPILGIRSMEDRTRLFHLVQMVKTLDLESLEYEDHDNDDYGIDGGDEGNALADSSITSDGCKDPDEDSAVSKLNATSFFKPSCVRRQLDFSCENTDDHQKLFSCPVDTVHVYSSHNRNNKPDQSKGSAIPVQLELDTGSVMVCSCKGNSNHKLDVHSHQYDHQAGANTMPDTVDLNCVCTSHTRLSARCASSHKRPATAASKKFSKKTVDHKDRKGITGKEEIGSNMASEHLAMTTPVYESKTAGYNYGLPLSSPPATNKKQPRGQRISVCVRKRPLTRAECRRGEADVVTTPSGECVIVHECKEAVDLTQYILQHKFYFDQVFGEESTNEEVYRRTAYPLVQHMLNGGKATCFAYGQTGAGKTHTMLGSSPGRPGLYALAVRDIFTHLSTTHTHSPLLVYVSFFEIYCGQLYDLLDHRKRLFAREDGQKVVHIAGLRDVKVDSVSSLLEVISQGTEERTQGTSGVNPLSSRSHALLQIQLRRPKQQIAGRMWFVDLAGSERASDTKEPDRQSRMEGAEINQSLLALKECIRSLDQEQSHTPFRQSKLTQVLKDSFVGDSMTCMIANISPGHVATEHTLNTLRYADRVKELRGQGGLRGGRRNKTIHSPKRNLSNSNSSSGGSSIGTRGKSPPKKPKLGRQREAFGPTTATSRLATGGIILCSTPKNRKWGEETSARARKGIGFEQISPIRGVLGIGDNREIRERVDGREGRRRETYEGSDNACHSIADQNIGAGLVFGQATDDQLPLSEVQRKGFYHREKENQQNPLKGGKYGERKGLEHVDNSTDTCNKEIRLRESDLQKVDESDKERKRHLKRYHQQLQKFIPLPASSSHHLFSPSTCPSFSSSNQTSISSFVSTSSCSSFQDSSALMYHDLEEFLDAHRARGEVMTDGNTGQLSSCLSGEICLQTESSPNYNKNKDEVCRGDSGGNSENLRVSFEGTKAGYGQDRSKSEKRSLKATCEGEVRVRREALRPAGMEREGERKWAWVATTEAEQTDRVTGVRPADVESLVSYNSDSEVGEEGLDASDVPGLWSIEDGAQGYGLVSTHSNNCNNSLSNHRPVESPHQRAPAERPLSPACEHTNTLLTPNKLSDLSLQLKHTKCASNNLPLPPQNTQHGVPSSSCREREPWFAANANRTEFSNAQTAESLSILSQNPADTHVHNHPEINLRMSALTQGETSMDSLSYIMDPLSISLLQVDQQVAKASFLQWEQNNTSLCLLENQRNEDEDVQFCPSLLELPQAKTRCPPTSDTMTASNHSERRKDMGFHSYKHCGIGMVKPPTTEVVSLQEQKNDEKLQTTPAVEVMDNKAPAFPLKPSTCASIETSAMQSISSSVQHSENTSSSSSQNLMKNGATQMPPAHAHNVHNKLASSTSKPHSESVLSQWKSLPKQCHTVHSNHCSHSNIPLQPNGATESNSEESNLQIRPIIHLSTLEDLYQGQWRVVQAHWEQLEEMETLCRKEGMLLCRQPDMAFGEYVHKLGEIMERKARCVHSMIAQLQPYLNTPHSQPHNQGKDIHDQVT